MTNRILLSFLGTMVVAGSSTIAQTVERSIDQLDSSHRLGRPVQMAISPSGGNVAIADQSVNLIYVVDPDGVLQWLIGEAVQISQPAGVVFDGEDRILFSTKNSAVIYAVQKSEPARLDTIADLTGKIPAKASIDQLLALPGGSHLILDRTLAAIYRFKPNWDFDRTIVTRGDRKGEVWAPSAMVVDLAGNIIVADEGHNPIQTFSRDGQFLFQGSWNAPQLARTWSAAAVCITRDDFVWVADVSGSRWRIFDRTGNELSQKEFTPPLLRPNAMIVLPDNRIMVAEERGLLILLKPD